jgi:hypothetical protein
VTSLNISNYKTKWQMADVLVPNISKIKATLGESVKRVCNLY